MAATDLAYYSGDDALTLPLLSIGAVGVVGTSTHFTGLGMHRLIEAHLAGDPATALPGTVDCCPIFTGVFATQGCILVKDGLRQRPRQRASAVADVAGHRRGVERSDRLPAGGRVTATRPAPRGRRRALTASG